MTRSFGCGDNGVLVAKHSVLQHVMLRVGPGIAVTKQAYDSGFTIIGEATMAEMVRDVVCGMTLDRDDVVASSEFEGKSYHFCSVECRQQFDSDARHFAGARSAQPDDTDDVELERHEPPFTQGPLTAPKFGSAGSGGAEYERLPEMHDDEGEKKRKRR